jgi:Flp pilus assembly pilin Flp
VDTIKSFKSSRKSIKGQGMSEYLVIVGLLAVAGIAAMGLMGGSVRTTMAAFADEFADGNNSATLRTEASTLATDAKDSAVAGLSNYDTNNEKMESRAGN